MLRLHWFLVGGLIASGCGDPFTTLNPPAQATGGGGSGAAGGGGSAGMGMGGGGAGNGGSGGGGGSSEGGQGGMPLDCAAPLMGGVVSLHSTLEDPNAVTSPAVGNGLAAAHVGTFGGGYAGKGLALGPGGDYVKWLLAVGPNGSLATGGVQFCIKPAWDHDDSNEVRLFSMGQEATILLALEKGAQGEIAVSVSTDLGMTVHTAIATKDDYAIKAGEWQRIVLLWDFRDAQPLVPERVVLFVERYRVPLDEGLADVELGIMPDNAGGIRFGALFDDGPSQPSADAVIDEPYVFIDVDDVEFPTD